MKKILLIFILFCFSLTIYASDVEPWEKIVEKNYLQRINTFIESIKENQLKLKIVSRRLEVLWDKINHIYTQEAKKVKEVISHFQEKLGKEIEEPGTFHLETPETVKSLYYTSFAWGSSTRINTLLKFVENSEINSVTIDIKEVDGYVAFDMSGYEFSSIIPISNNRIKDVRTLIENLHEKGIYVIGRITVFKDKLLAETRPDLAIKWSDGKNVWYDYKWNKYLDPYSKEVWDYTVEISKAAYDLWFDEINFDYVRFPSDGAISNTYYPFAKEIESEHPKWGKIMVLDKFSSYITSQLKKEYSDIVLSSDIFGLVTRSDLFRIGQNLESFLLYFDYVLPMIYPSHYWVGTLGYQVPDNYPYEIIENALYHSNKRIDDLNVDIKDLQEKGEKQIKIKDVFFTDKDITNIQPIPKTRIRPWLQWFSCTWCKGYTPYNRAKFREQVRAVEDAWLTSWWVWNSGSRYYLDWYNKE